MAPKAILDGKDKSIPPVIKTTHIPIAKMPKADDWTNIFVKFLIRKKFGASK